MVTRVLAALALLAARCVLADDDGGARGDVGARAPDTDARVIEHLDELQQLELLENLGLLDATGDDDAAPPDGAPPPSRAR